MGELTREQFEAAGGLALRKADDTIHDVKTGLNKQDRLVLRLALKRSWLLHEPWCPDGRCAAYMPSLAMISEESGVNHKGHASEALGRLVAKNVLIPLTAFSPKYKGWYAVNHKFDAWRVTAKAHVEVAEEQGEFLFEDLKRILTVVFVENIKDGSPTFLPIQAPAAVRDLPHATKSPADHERSDLKEGGLAIRGQPSQAEKTASDMSSCPAPSSFHGDCPPGGGVPQEEVAHTVGDSNWLAAHLVAAVHGAPVTGGSAQAVPKKGNNERPDEAAPFPNFGKGATSPGPDAVPKKGMEPENLNAGAAVAEVPKFGKAQALPVPSAKGFPPHPLSKPNESEETITSGASSPNSVPKKGIGAEPETSMPPDEERPPAKVTWSEERRLMERIAEFVGGDKRNEHEMAQSGSFWRERVVRAFPAQIDEAVSEGRMLAQTGYEFTSSRAAWLNTKIARLAGRKNLKEAPKRARPTK